MSLALYRKYRPATFAEVVGQEHVTGPLRQALTNGRLNHAYLFSGPRGCGKTSSARILARSLNCAQGPTPDPCGVCDSCVALAPGGPGSLDVIEIDAASHNGVDDARDLRDRAMFSPVSSRFKVYIIDEAHMVTKSAFNALLKLVEEPPPFVKFVFATTEPDEVLATIRSRTHQYPFRLLPPGVLRQLLEEICAKEGVAVEPAVYPLVVGAGAGSARDSLSVMDQLLAGAGAAGVTYADALPLLGVTDIALLDETVDGLAAGDAASVFETVDRVVEAGHDARRFAVDLLQRLRDLIILNAVPEAATKGLLAAPEDQIATMQSQATRLGPATLSRMADVVHESLEGMRGTTSPRLLLELVCARMLLPAATGDPAAMLQRLERLERRLDIAGPTPAVAVPTGLPSAASGSVPGAPTRQSPTRQSPTPAAQPTPEPAPASPAPSGASATGEPADSRNGAGASTRPAVAAGTGAATTGPGSPGARSDAPAAGRGTAVAGDDVPAEGGDALAAGGDELVARSQRPADVSKTAATHPVVEQPAAAAAPGGLDAAAVRRSWPGILDAVRAQRRTVAAYLLDATVVAVDGGTLVLSFPHAFHAKALSTAPSVDYFTDALEQVLGVRWSVRCEVADGSQQPALDGKTASTPPREVSGFAPGDAPADEAEAGETGPVQTQEEQAIALLAQNLGARKIGEVENG